MRLIQHNGLNRLQFSALTGIPGFFHGVFLREFSDSRGGRKRFNLGLGQGDPETVVWTNRKKMTASFGAGLQEVYGRQVHGNGVAVLKEDENTYLLDSAAPLSLKGDALVTDMARAALVIIVADCQPVLIIDPVKKVVGNVHSGWRGSIQNIIGATIQRMVDDFRSEPEDLICGIGPSLGPCCAEFINYKDEIPESFWRYRHSTFHFDFWKASRNQLTEAGVKPDNVSISGLCTQCNPHLFFSYRGERDSGRFAAVVGIEPGEGCE